MKSIINYLLFALALMAEDLRFAARSMRQFLRLVSNFTSPWASVVIPCFQLIKALSGWLLEKKHTSVFDNKAIDLVLVPSGTCCTAAGSLRVFRY